MHEDQASSDAGKITGPDVHSDGILDGEDNSFSACNPSQEDACLSLCNGAGYGPDVLKALSCGEIFCATIWPLRGMKSSQRRLSLPA